MSSSEQAPEEIAMFIDARGCVFEPVDAETLPKQRNVHVALTEPGHVRGNHYHRRIEEHLVAVGPALVRWRAGGTVRDFHVHAGKAFRFHFLPGVAHAIVGTGTQPLLIVSFGDQAHNPADPDVVRDVLIEPQPPVKV